MKSSSRSLAIFLTGCAVTFLVWDLFHGGPPSTDSQVPEIEQKPREDSWSQENVVSGVKALEAAEDDPSRLRAALELSRIPVKDIPAVLESFLNHERAAALPAFKTLLIRWASSDGEAAMNWAWTHLREKRDWNEAYHEIIAAWAWQDGHGFHRWCLASPHLGYMERHQVAGAAQKSAMPVIDMFFVVQAVNHLVEIDPYLAYDLIAKRGGGFYGLYPRYAESFESADQIRDALSALPDPGNLKAKDLSDSQLATKALLEHWRRIDPDDFADSSYAHTLAPDPAQVLAGWKELDFPERSTQANSLLSKLDGEAREKQLATITLRWAAESPQEAARWLRELPEAASGYIALAGLRAPRDLDGTLDWVESLPPVDEAAGIAKAYEAWTTAHPGQSPDTAGWSASRLQAWQDMAALAQGGGG
ncbi:hypothetical protein OJ996_10835 [Luteolibacter sp. GHJ8]|uniref:DUF4034 domain-containing protein n=1 Tax=Luteolibacter rhizosphaerae TaxID=2989719 RepID=A0ABT3G2L4_9BACT|nr:hypothetical protein [Luteolibacter rhizosphaerae]MCW1914073.1 hypothetical protein [Luteolibacter rhizosphaerae]